MRKLVKGCHVVFIDSKFERHDALVTQVFGDGRQEFDPADRSVHIPCVNLLYVSKDEDRTDPYGSQIVRETSCVHRSNNSAGANCWIFEGEQ